MSGLEFLLVTLVGYIVGSIPFAVMIGIFHGVDILQQGSGNPGATNVKRVIGKGAGYFCFVGDSMKGLLAAGWPQLHVFEMVSDPLRLAFVGLVAAVLGHSYSVFIRFKGGKGVATIIGGLFAIMTNVLLISVVVWLIVFYITRYVSFASICLCLSLPLLALICREPIEVIVLCLFFAIFITLRHRSNIRRLISGTEDRMQKET
ncbi:MAG: Glycerol-3-phosphate acyltransferase [Candidatus Moanabacter tarae]|uniref:Glycerol-3-phosphate acyltransferase n=1 Tax=Candidatus Moanibacter tarae TaxID=2200854 RepID=A0A2Z4AF90_9BACT|nr:MAG: Glycerol-3-phosphate acyltransferase [Candidatus Moanabacter tarae]|tara:strand:- start:5897 stop:6508 length:612 start_codon:yes stop_codon:yes gene_type:complete